MEGPVLGCPLMSAQTVHGSPDSQYTKCACKMGVTFAQPPQFAFGRSPFVSFSFFFSFLSTVQKMKSEQYGTVIFPLYTRVVMRAFDDSSGKEIESFVVLFFCSPFFSV